MEKRRFLELDVLRGIAVLIVLLFHYTTKYNEVFNTELMSLLEFKYGHYGVHLFFIISGYVIFLTINKIKSGKEFIVKRFLRLYPTFWLCLIFTFLITSFFSGIPRFQRTFYEFFVNFSMVPSYFGIRKIDGVYWSLLYELEFYFFMYILYLFKKLNKIELINFVWLIVSFIVLLFFDSSKLKILLIADYSFLFIAGINFYRLRNQNRIINHIQIICCFLFIVYFGELEEFFFTGLFFMAFYFIVYGKMIFLSKFKIFIFLGYISYPLYLIHQFFGMSIIHKINSFGINNYFVLLVSPLLLSVVLSWLITKQFEGKLLVVLRNKMKRLY